MNQHLITLTMWSPEWDNNDDVDLENRSSVSESLRAYVKNPFDRSTFKSCIPYRLKGIVHGHQKHLDCETVLTTFVHDVRQIEPIGRTAAYEVETWSGTVYTIELENALPTWL